MKRKTGNPTAGGATSGVRAGASASGRNERIRDLRLRALGDIPEAFAETLKEAQQLTDDEWKERVASSEERASFVEEADDGGLIGMVFGVFDASQNAAYLGGICGPPPLRWTRRR